MYGGQKDVFTGFVSFVFIRLEVAQMSSSGTQIASSQKGKERKGYFINNFNSQIKKSQILNVVLNYNISGTGFSLKFSFQ